MNKLAIIILTLALVYTRIELSELSQSHANLQAKYLDQADKIDEVYELSKAIDQETVYILSETVNRLEATIAVHDENVDIYNNSISTLESNINDLYDYTNDLNKRFNNLINILQVYL